MTSTDTEAPIIDAHAHVYTLDMPRMSESWHRPPADASIDDYIAALDENNVTFGIWPPPASTVTTMTIN